MKTKMIPVLLILALTIPSLALAGATDARVRAIHASPDAPNVDVLANDLITLFTDVPFKGIGEYQTVVPELYNVKVVGTGGAPADAVINANVNLFFGTDTTVIAIDELDDIRPIVLTDNNSEVPAGKARARFVHGSPDAPRVDIKAIGGPILFSDTGFGEASGYQTFPAGTYDIEVRVAGTDMVAKLLPAVPFNGGSVYTIIAVDFLDNLDVLLSEDAAFDGMEDDSGDDDEGSDDDDESSDDEDDSDDSSNGWQSFWERLRNSRR